MNSFKIDGHCLISIHCPATPLGSLQPLPAFVCGACVVACCCAAPQHTIGSLLILFEPQFLCD